MKRGCFSFHRCTNGNGKNKAAFVEEYDVLCRWIAQQEEPVLVMGDHNCGHKKEHKGASKLIAQHTGSKLTFNEDDPGIEYGIRRGLKGHVNRRGKYGSDHNAVVFVRDD